MVLQIQFVVKSDNPIIVGGEEFKKKENTEKFVTMNWTIAVAVMPIIEISVNIAPRSVSAGCSALFILPSFVLKGEVTDVPIFCAAETAFSH